VVTAMRKAGASSFGVTHIVKPTGWVVDMRHDLYEDTGDLPDGLPAAVLNVALFFGSIVRRGPWFMAERRPHWP
jgi:hypothetical protein